MPRKIAKPSTAKSPNQPVVNQENHSTNGSSPPKLVVITAFCVAMFQQLSHPNDDPSQPPTMRTVMNIQPESIWASLTKYRNCILNGENYSVHQYAIVSRAQPLPKTFHPLDPNLQVPCVARILEVRGADPKNVWLRLYWLYRPEEIPSGRKDHHGKNELIATSHMEIVDALQVTSPVQVRRLEEEKEEEEGHLPAAAAATEKDSLYFRQTYDFVTQEISDTALTVQEKIKAPRTTCICNHPINPDRSALLIRCTNPACRALLHPTCLQRQTLTELHHRYENSTQPGGNSRVTSGPVPRIQFQQHEGVIFSASNATTTTGSGRGVHFRVEMVESQRAETKGRTRFCITDLWEDNRSWEVDMQCGKCFARIL
ncbi:MAG: hypothetical protein LQ348_003507 [Seirophora lacunosa]|nr:MAG: hypothetical protein LQ344_004399 [Seirophora lacunosa]KAI4191528.1 MAG: hypothetical protein LQ348_003507 [Seirophora lacunosa]